MDRPQRSRAGRRGFPGYPGVALPPWFSTAALLLRRALRNTRLAVVHFLNRIDIARVPVEKRHSLPVDALLTGNAVFFTAMLAFRFRRPEPVRGPPTMSP